jgi:type I restriction enzyme S subunit
MSRMLKCRVGDLGKVVTGRTPPSSKPECFGGEFPFITPSDMDGRKTIRTTERYLSKAGYSLLRSNLLPASAVAVSCIGWQMGKSTLTNRPSFTNQQLNSIIPDRSRVDADYLYYALTTRREELKRLGSVGTRTPILNKSAFCALEIELPELASQRRIASILSAYDDLIENNTRRINILEDMAQMLYREWFVNFRFPGHEKVRMVESELGPIPEGWPVVGFDEISDILSGGTPKTTEPSYWNGPIPFFGPTDAPDNFYVIGTTKSITELGLSKCNSKLYPAETVFITARGTVGKVALPASSMAMNQSCYALRGKRGINQLALFLITKDCARQLKQKSHGAVFDTITIETFQKLRIVRPTDTLLSMLESAARPLFGLVLNLLRRNATLRTTRDFLLPKLISGEVPVEAAAELMEQTA